LPQWLRSSKQVNSNDGDGDNEHICMAEQVVYNVYF